jgi:hypothetical protein
VDFHDLLGLKCSKTHKNCSNHLFRAVLDTLCVLRDFSRFLILFCDFFYFIRLWAKGWRGSAFFHRKEGGPTPLNFDQVRPMVVIIISVQISAVTNRLVSTMYAGPSPSPTTATLWAPSSSTTFATATATNTSPSG